MKMTKSSIPFNLGKEKEVNPFLCPRLDYLNKLKYKKNLSSFDFFTYLRELKNNF
jgi:hypothetical protein